MDIATLIGLMVAVGSIVWAMYEGTHGHLATFYSTEGFVLVLGGSFAIYRFVQRRLGMEHLEKGIAAFDPERHEIVGITPEPEAEPGTVVREVRRGWRLGDALLRPAQVVVAAPATGAGSCR